jgi:alpha-tubulin suppressor-like RCC1 family protein
MTSKIFGSQIADYSINTEQLSNTAIAAFATNAEFANYAVALGPRVRSINVANSMYSVLDVTSVNVGGGYIVVSGNNFVSGASVLVGDTLATTVNYVDSTTLRVEVPAKTSQAYDVYVVNPDGGTGIRVSGLTYNTIPTFITDASLTQQISATAFGFNISANSDSNITYSNTSALPAGTTLLSNGWFYGVNTVNVDTDYSFTVKATNAGLQNASKTFNISTYISRSLISWGSNEFGQLGQNNVLNRSSPVQVGTAANWSEVVAGQNTNAALKTDGTLWLWGRNHYGQLGLGDKVYKSSPTQLGTGTTWSKVSIGKFNGAAIKTDGTLWMWGFNNQNQLGNNDGIARSSPIQVGSDNTWLSISAGYANHGIKTNGTLWGWGDTSDGQLGFNDIVVKSSPTQVGALTNWQSITNWISITAGIKTNGTLWLWGRSNYGQLGLNDIVNRSSPVQVGTDTNWRSIKAGYRSVIATKTDGTVWVWGYNNYGQLGLPDKGSNKSSPTQLGTGTNWDLISAGYYNTIATKTDGTLWAWGRNTGGTSPYTANGTLGQNDDVQRSSPVQVGTGTTWSKIALQVGNVVGIIKTVPIWTSSSFLPAVTKGQPFNGQFVATGANTYSLAAGSTLPDGMTISANGYYYGINTTVTSKTTYNFTVTATSPYGTTSNSTMSLIIGQPSLWTWGNNGSGNLGLNNTIQRSSPVQVGTGTDWNNISISSASTHTLATKYDGTLWAWGRDASGALGINNNQYRSSPTQVGTGTTWLSVGAGNYVSAAIKTDGTLWTWGKNDVGQLSLNNVVYRSSPTQVGTDTNWSKVESGLSSFYAIKTDGTLWVWGINDQYGLGLGDTVTRSSPVQVGSGTNWLSVTVGWQNVLATKTDGTLWVWGRNDHGQLGIGNRIDTSSPTQIGALTTWSSAKIGLNNAVAIKTDGTLWVWGQNTNGQLGLNTITTNRSSPIQVGTSTDWANVLGTTFDGAQVTKTNSTLWAWGYNLGASLGQNNTFNRSSPTQVGTDTGWIKLDGYSHAAAIKLI